MTLHDQYKNSHVSADDTLRWCDMEMDMQQERHLLHIKQQFELLCDPKYRKGAEEHGGKMEDYEVIDLLNMAIDEAIDMVVYLVTARDKEEMARLDRLSE